MATLSQIVGILPQFSILETVVGYIDGNVDGSDLGGALDSEVSDLTVFAPTNSAFGALATDLGYLGDPADEAAVVDFLVANVPVETLETVVLYHLSAGSQSSTDIATSGSVLTLQGGSITANLPTLVDAEPNLIDPSILYTDIPASNGVVHVIDRVLLPIDLPGNDAPTITGIVASSGEGFDGNPQDFDILLAAVQTAGLAGALDDAHADYTTFAPTDQAFLDLAAALGFEGSSEEDAFGYLVEALTLLGGGNPIPLLTNVLLYHVAPESLQASQVLGEDSIPTLLKGAEIGVDGTTLVDNDPDLPDPGIIATDIQAANGVVHVIDGVLIPADLLQSDGSNDVDFIIDDGGFGVFNTGADNDYVDGNAGVDIIQTGAGNDTIIGGKGNDIISGGAGEDTFIFALGDGDDTIIGFESGEDTITVTGLKMGMGDAEMAVPIGYELTEGAFRTVIDFYGEDAGSITVYHGFNNGPTDLDINFGIEMA